MLSKFVHTGVSIAALGLVLWTPPPAAAQTQRQCNCLYNGERYVVGRCVCMKTPSGPRLACCGQVLNNPSWSFKTGGCPLASETSPSPELAAISERDRPEPPGPSVSLPNSTETAAD